MSPIPIRVKKSTPFLLLVMLVACALAVTVLQITPQANAATVRSGHATSASGNAAFAPAAIREQGFPQTQTVDGVKIAQLEPEAYVQGSWCVLADQATLQGPADNVLQLLTEAEHEAHELNYAPSNSVINNDPINGDVVDTFGITYGVHDPDPKECTIAYISSVGGQAIAHHLSTVQPGASFKLPSAIKAMIAALAACVVYLAIVWATTAVAVAAGSAAGGPAGATLGLYYGSIVGGCLGGFASGLVSLLILGKPIAQGLVYGAVGCVTGALTAWGAGYVSQQIFLRVQGFMGTGGAAGAAAAEAASVGASSVSSASIEPYMLEFEQALGDAITP